MHHLVCAASGNCSQLLHVVLGLGNFSCCRARVVVVGCTNLWILYCQRSFQAAFVLESAATDATPPDAGLPGAFFFVYM